MAQPNPPSARPPWLDLGKRPERLTPTSSVLVVLALVVLGGGIVAAAMRGSAPSTLLRPAPTLRPTSVAARHGFPQTISCSAAGVAWACVSGDGGHAYKLLAVRVEPGRFPVSTLIPIGPDNGETSPRAGGAPAPRALACLKLLVQLLCDSRSLAPIAGTPLAIYVRSR
jgi:hypothetical protein